MCGGCVHCAFSFSQVVTHTADEDQFGLEVHVVGELQVLHKAGGFEAVAVAHHEFDVLGGGIAGDPAGLTEFLRAHGSIDERHRHGLALTLAVAKPVAAGELGAASWPTL